MKADGNVKLSPLHLIAMILIASALASCAPAREPVTSGSSRPSPTTSNGNLFVSGEPCTGSSISFLPPRAGCVSLARADLDGDQREDTIAVYADVDARDLPTSWHIGFDLGSGRLISRMLNAGTEISYPKIVGATDIADDGRAEVFVTLVDHFLHGAVTHDLGLFALVDGDLRRVRQRGVGPFTFASVRFTRLAEGARCVDVLGDERREFVTTRLWSVHRQNRLWRWSKRIYERVGRELVFRARRTGRLRVSGYNDPALDPFFEVRCDHVVLP